jgi:hypothetical protein
MLVVTVLWTSPPRVCREVEVEGRSLAQKIISLVGEFK